MKIYVDVVLFINFSFDLLILLSTSIVLKRKTSFNRLLFGAFIGSLSILFLFIKITSFQLFLLKIIISIIMVLISFGFKNVKYFLKNMLFLYTISIILGGFLYYLSCAFSYKNTGLVFYFKGLNFNFNADTIYRELEIDNKTYDLNGFKDTGNNLKDPYFSKPIILVNRKLNFKNFIVVPYSTASGESALKCTQGKVIYKNRTYDVYVGIIDSLCIDGVDCLLNNKMEGIC